MFRVALVGAPTVVRKSIHDLASLMELEGNVVSQKPVRRTMIFLYMHVYHIATELPLKGVTRCRAVTLQLRDVVFRLLRHTPNPHERMNHCQDSPGHSESTTHFCKETTRMQESETGRCGSWEAAVALMAAGSTAASSSATADFHLDCR